MFKCPSPNCTSTFASFSKCKQHLRKSEHCELYNLLQNEPWDENNNTIEMIKLACAIPHQTQLPQSVRLASVQTDLSANEGLSKSSLGLEGSFDRLKISHNDVTFPPTEKPTTQQDQEVIHTFFTSSIADNLADSARSPTTSTETLLWCTNEACLMSEISFKNQKALVAHWLEKHSGNPFNEPIAAAFHRTQPSSISTDTTAPNLNTIKSVDTPMRRLAPPTTYYSPSFVNQI